MLIKYYQKWQIDLLLPWAVINVMSPALPYIECPTLILLLRCGKMICSVVAQWSVIFLVNVANVWGLPFITDPIIFISWKTPAATNLVNFCYGKLKYIKLSIVAIPTQLGLTPLCCSVYVTYSRSHWKWYISKQMKFLSAWNAAFQNCVLWWRFSLSLEPRSLIWKTYFISTSLCNFSALLILPIK